MPTKKTSAAKKPRATRKTAKGDNYVCDVCGCEEVHEIICCEQPMARKATRAKAAK